MIEENSLENKKRSERKEKELKRREHGSQKMEKQLKFQRSTFSLLSTANIMN
jgi:hypothetical protein